MPEKQDKKYLGFLSIEESQEKNRYTGCLLITNLYGVPEEFRCTHPVKPTPIQKTLYGKSLVSHIGIELCGIPLLSSIEHKISGLFVNADYLTELRHDADFPVLFVKRSGEILETEQNGEFKKEKRKIESKTGKFEPVAAIWNEQFKDDYEKMMHILDNHSNNLDVIEPFGRIKKTVEVLTLQDDRFK